MGNPHAVTVVDSVDATVSDIGQAIQNTAISRFSEGFMEPYPARNRLRVLDKVGETLACGTGACAAMTYGRHWTTRS